MEPPPLTRSQLEGILASPRVISKMIRQLFFSVVLSLIATAALAAEMTRPGHAPGNSPISAGVFRLWPNVAPALRQSAQRPNGVAVLNSSGQVAFVTTKYSGAVTNSAGLSSSSPVFDGAAAGMDGTGATDNQSKFSTLLTAATASASGGYIHVGCGTYLFDSSMSATVANAEKLIIRGDGSYCTKFLFHNTNGLTINHAGKFSASELDGISFLTDAANSYNALTITSTSGTSQPGQSPVNDYRDLTFIGADCAPSDTCSDFWANAFTMTGISNVNIWGGLCAGLPNAFGNGNCYGFSGTGKGAYPASIALNFFGTLAYGCNVALTYGSYAEGITLNAVNFTACHKGVNTASSTADQDGLDISNSQMETDVCGVCITNTTFNNENIFGSTFIPHTGDGIQVGGVGFNINGNSISGADSDVGNAINFPLGTSGLGGIVQNNQLGNTQYGINVAAGIGVIAIFKDNRWGAPGRGTSAKFNIGSRVTGGIEILDREPATFAQLPACSTLTAYSQMFVIDAPTSSAYYGEVRTGRGTQRSTLACDAAHWRID